MKWKLPVLFFILASLILCLDLQEQNFLLSDLGKDILVAKHLANGFTETIFIRPNSTWAELPLTPLYFWFIALLYAGVRSPFGMTICVAVMKIMMLFVLFFLGRAMRNTRLGIIFLILVGTSEYYLTLRLNPFLFATLFFLLGLYTYIRATEGRKVNGTWLFASILFVFLVLGVHISTLVILPSFLFLWTRGMTRLERRQQFMMVVFMVFMSFLLVSMTYHTRMEISTTAIIHTLLAPISPMEIGARGKTLFFLFTRSSQLATLFLIPAIIYFIRVKHEHRRITLLTLMGSLGLFL